ncbi:ATP-dependent Clp protease ATP-binding subunit ClpX [Striga asiatica]|uniref:ATP-dependent Clp protease ATP-binding subunit ClpX n=1 Tax=Striga asiatica TaxID=4170 RepID=A0A5A7RC84_STRAF|nr:ATP-dependent Clp protease ATP-binding subunit ClpX [Striga asiatica]
MQHSTKIQLKHKSIQKSSQSNTAPPCRERAYMEDASIQDKPPSHEPQGEAHCGLLNQFHPLIQTLIGTNKHQSIIAGVVVCFIPDVEPAVDAAGEEAGATVDDMVCGRGRWLRGRYVAVGTTNEAVIPSGIWSAADRIVFCLAVKFPISAGNGALQRP